MSVTAQRTLRQAIHCAGVGLHSGAAVSMSLFPADPGSGLRFRRSDLFGEPIEIEATWRNAIESPLSTTLVGEDGTRIATVEHLLSAFYGCGIDNALVELSGGEVPAIATQSFGFAIGDHTNCFDEFTALQSLGQTAGE